jgi:hypothetical protein
MNQERSEGIQSSNEKQIEKDNASHPVPDRRTEDPNSETRFDLPADAVQPGINEASDDPN